MAEIRVRAYNVRFGDAILVTVPDADPDTGVTVKRHILIDVGNVLNKDGGDDSVFAPIVEDVVRELDGRPLDLYVMTHEHLDHVQGLYFVASPDAAAFRQRLPVDYAWLTASAARDYYDTHPDAKKQKGLLLDAYDRIAAFLGASPLASGPLGAILANNNPRKTSECIEFLRGLASQRTTYVSRGTNLSGCHPFREAKFEIWAPEEDTSDYYRSSARSLLPAALHVSAGDAGAAPVAVRPVPPSGVDAGSFYDLVDARSRGFVDNLLAIDKAANNTSVVFSLAWRGWHLLFAGDAELGSWRMMHRRGVLRPVDFLKVSHHGSHNGTPDDDVFDAFLPEQPPGARARHAMISTWPETYSNIPHGPTDERLLGRCELHTTIQDRDAPWVDLTFRA